MAIITTGRFAEINYQQFLRFIHPQFQNLKILVIIGTRPEVIKLATLIKILKESSWCEIVICHTSQQGSLVDDIIDILDVPIDIRLDPIESQSLTHRKVYYLEELNALVNRLKPQYIIVQGDTLSAFCGAMSAFFHRIKLVHIESGLRSHDMKNPFPEEAFRKIIDQVSDIHFAPSELAVKNLVDEKVSQENIYLTGNTGKDMALSVLNSASEKNYCSEVKEFLTVHRSNGLKVVLLTMHRRENQGAFINSVLDKIEERLSDDYAFIFIRHPHTVDKSLKGRELKSKQIVEIDPLNYVEMMYLLTEVDLVMTDSGGIQEESSYLNKPVIILRKNTERPEVIEQGGGLIYNSQTIEADIKKLLDREIRMDKLYGDGKASEKIVQILKELSRTLP